MEFKECAKNSHFSFSGAHLNFMWSLLLKFNLVIILIRHLVWECTLLPVMYGAMECFCMRSSHVENYLIWK